MAVGYDGTVLARSLQKESLVLLDFTSWPIDMANKALFEKASGTKFLEMIKDVLKVLHACKQNHSDCDKHAQNAKL